MISTDCALSSSSIDVRELFDGSWKINTEQQRS